MAAQSQAALPAAPQGFAGSFVQICLRDEVQTFLDLVQAIYKRLKTSVSGTFQPSILAEAAKAAAGEMTGGTSMLSIAGNGGAGAATFTADYDHGGSDACSRDSGRRGGCRDDWSLQRCSSCPNRGHGEIYHHGVGSGEVPSLTSIALRRVLRQREQRAPEALRRTTPARNGLVQGADGVPIDCHASISAVPRVHQQHSPALGEHSAGAAHDGGASALGPAGGNATSAYASKSSCMPGQDPQFPHISPAVSQSLAAIRRCDFARRDALMKACPGEAVSTRRELLVATRHILATDFKKGQSDLSLDACMHDPYLRSLQLV